MHAQRQVHHDVKSGNVLLSAGHCVCVLADTGSSYALPPGVDFLRETPPLENLNYPCWAPEFVAEGLVRPACDVFSFGVLLCELLSSKPATMPRLATDGVVALLRPALEAGTPEAIADAQVRWPPPLLRALGGLAARCIYVDGSRRPTSAAVAAELEHACVAAGLGSQPVCGASALPEQAATPVGQPALARLPSGADDVQAVPSRGRARRALAPAAIRAATEQQQEGPPAKRLRSFKAPAHQLAAAPAGCEEAASPAGGCAVAHLLVDALLCGAHSQRLKACQSVATLAAALPAAVEDLLAAGVVPPLVTLLSRARRGARGCHLAAAAASSLGFLVGPPGSTPNRGAQDAAGRSGAVAFLLAALQAAGGDGGADGQTKEEEKEEEEEEDAFDGAAQPPSSSQQHSGFSGSEGQSSLLRRCALPPPIFAATLLALLDQHEGNQERAMQQDAVEAIMGLVGRTRDAALVGPFDAGSSQSTAKLIPYAVKCLHVLTPLAAGTRSLGSLLSLGLSLCNPKLPRTAALAGAHLVQGTLTQRPRLSAGPVDALSVERTLGGLARAAAAALGELNPSEMTAVLAADPRLSVALVTALSPGRSAPLPLLSVLACGNPSSDVDAQPGQLAAAVAARAALLSAAPLLVAALRAGEPARTRSADALEALVRSGPDAALTVARAWAVAPLASLERQTGLGRAQAAASEVLDCLASHPGLASEVARARAGAALTVTTAVARF